LKEKQKKEKMNLVLNVLFFKLFIFINFSLRVIICKYIISLMDQVIDLEYKLIDALFIN
jgi:hypothetical protein